MVYELNKTNHFRSSMDEFGCFGNMCGGYPITLESGKVIHGSEILYQWFKYKGYSNIQHELLEFKNPLKAKWYQKKYVRYIRDDWDDIKIDIMKFCCLTKYKQHIIKLKKFIDKIKENGYPIVEVSKRDNFWGCIPNKNDNNIVEGENNLGKIWVDIANNNLFIYNIIQIEEEFAGS
jgi:ribA/ribD-fused uncharacterized protein